MSVDLVYFCIPSVGIHRNAISESSIVNEIHIFTVLVGSSLGKSTNVREKVMFIRVEPSDRIQ